MALARALILCSILLVSGALAAGQRMVGAPFTISENDEGVRDALQFAMTQYNMGSNDKYTSKVAEVISVQKQLVAGIKYILDVKVGRTTCPKQALDLEGCAFQTEETVTCRFEVLTVPWLNQIRLIKNNCQ